MEYIIFFFLYNLTNNIKIINLTKVIAIIY